MIYRKQILLTKSYLIMRTQFSLKSDNCEAIDFYKAFDMHKHMIIWSKN